MHRCMLAAAVCLLFLGGCDTTVKPKESEGGAPAVTGKKLKIGFIPKGSTHEFWKTMQAGAEEEASKQGVELLWKGPLKEDDRAEQIKVVENFTAQKLDGIILAPLDEEALKAPVKEAQAQGIPVLIVDSGLKDVETVSFIATDNFQAGKMGGKKLAEVMGGKGKALLLRYQEGSASTMERERGFLEAAKEGGIEVVSSEQYGGATRESAQTASENLLSRFSKGGALDVQGIFTPNESTTFGMLRALQNAKFAGKVKFVGFDSSQELEEAVTKGEIQGLVIQDPAKMGREGVAQMVKHIKKETVEKRIDTGAQMVTAETLKAGK